MKKVSHIIWTFSISLWIYHLFFPEFNTIENILISLITAIFSSLPDIDLKIVNYFKKLNYKTLFLSYPIYFLIKTIFKHRTITHSFLFSSIFYIGYYIFSNILNNTILNIQIFSLSINLSLFLAYLSFSIFLAITLHIFEDSLTVAGVEPLYPIKIKIRFARFRTNSSISQIIIDFVGFLIGVLFFIY